MAIDRRTAIKWMAATVAALGLPRARRLAYASPVLGVRPVAAGDAAAIQAIISSCVSDDDSFFGKCGEWSLAWAEELIVRCPQSIVVTRDGEPVGFFELKPIKPPLAPLEGGVSIELVAKFELRQRNRGTCRINAAGIRYDSPEEAVLLFTTLLYEAFRAAQAAGYEYVEAYAPWEKHPMMAQKFTDYPGCDLVDPPARNQAGGHDVYHLRWRLADAVPTLGLEERFRVA